MAETTENSPRRQSVGARPQAPAVRTPPSGPGQEGPGLASGGDRKKRFQVRKKVCRFASTRPFIDYKDSRPEVLHHRAGKILPPHLRQLREAPARGHRGDPARPKHRAPAVLRRAEQLGRTHSTALSQREPGRCRETAGFPFFIRCRA